VINNYLDITILNEVQIPVAPGVAIPYVFPSDAIGNVDLKEERLDALEVGYVGNFGSDLVLTLAVYENKTIDSIDFFTLSTYTGSNPPLGFPLPPFVLDVPPPFGLAGLFPESFSYRNIGEQTNRGVEFSLNGDPSPTWSWFFNYSWQDTPDVVGVPLAEVNLAPENRVNLGLAYSGDRYFWNANANYQDEAFWTDVLDSRYFGPTDSFTQVNLGIGIWFQDGRSMFKIDAQNIADEDVQQHVFGDIIGRKITGRVAVRF
ncbi:MAG: TonB-dependent receptor, partial [Acidobacteriota bacterium]|nr:TonB-dependent receptor [Acidobacteriota bacterium]